MYQPSDTACNQDQEPGSCGSDHMPKWALEMGELNDSYPTSPMENFHSWDTGNPSLAPFNFYNPEFHNHSSPQWNSLQVVPPPFPGQGMESELQRLAERMAVYLKDIKVEPLPSQSAETKSEAQEVMDTMGDIVAELKRERELGVQAYPPQVLSLESQVKQRTNSSLEWLPTSQHGVYEILPEGYHDYSSTGEEESEEESWTAPLCATPLRWETNAAASGEVPDLPQAGDASEIQHSPILERIANAIQELDSSAKFLQLHVKSEREAQEEESRIKEPWMNGKGGEEATTGMWCAFQSKYMRYLLPHAFSFPQDYGEKRDPTWVEGKHLRDDLALKILFYDPP